MPSGEGGGTSAGEEGGSGEGNEHPALVVAGTEELGAFNPVSGYGEQGGTPVYEGLLRLRSTDPEELPELEPALAAEAPTASEDLTTWRVPVRDGVSFHDGSQLGPEDVVASPSASTSASPSSSE